MLVNNLRIVMKVFILHQKYHQKISEILLISITTMSPACHSKPSPDPFIIAQKKGHVIRSDDLKQ